MSLIAWEAREPDSGAFTLSLLLERVRAALEARYEVEGIVGTGAMATVFRASDRSLHRPVAIKVLRPQLATAVGAERFVREARCLASLSHPHLVSVHDAGEADGLYYYVMDLIEAESLRQVLSRGRLPPARAVALVAGLLEALEVVHAAGLVHRDIKPENIFVQGDHPLLADFGIAKSLADEGGTLTRAGAFLGTPAYMSPEQAQGRGVGVRSDLYSVGQVLYECLTGRRWLLGARGEEADWSGVPSHLRLALVRALEPLEARRWPDAASFRAALDGVSAVVVPSRARGAGYALAAVVVAAAGVAIWSPWSAPAADRVRSVAITACVDESPAGDQPQLAGNIFETLWLAFVEPRIGLEEVRSARGWEGPIDPGRIADSLAVDAVVTCTVRPGGDDGRRLSGAVRLESGGGPPVWEWTFDERLTDFAGRAGAEVAAAFERPIEIDAVPFASPPSFEAVMEYTQAREDFGERSEDPAFVDSAMRHHERALELAPRWPLAMAGLAECYLTRVARGAGTAAEDFSKADSLAREATDIEDALADPYAVRGEARRAYFWSEWDEAETYYRQYIERGSGSAEGRLWYALWLTAERRFEEAIAHARASIETFDRADDVRIGLGQILYLSKDYEGAISLLTDVVEAWPLAWEGQLWLVAALIEEDRKDEARARLDAVAARLSGADDQMVEAVRPALAAAYAGVGAFDEARDLLDSRSRHGAFWQAIAYSLLGDDDEAIRQLELAEIGHDEFLTFAGIFPLLEKLRADPRFDATVGDLPWMRGS